MMAHFDLLVKGARLLDPAQGIDRVSDIAVHQGKIAAIGDLAAESADQSVDGSGLIASPGWIDLHVHVMQGGIKLGGVHADNDAGIATGVTTVVDAGSSGAGTWAQFHDEVMATSTTRVLAYMNISLQPATNGPRHGEWSNFSQAQTIESAERAAANGDCVGIKVLASQTHCGNLGITPVKLARQAARLSGTGLMVHIGNAPPMIEDVLDLLDEGDIVTHCWHGKYGGLLGRDRKPLPEVWAAVDRGVKFDIGHGAASFAFKTARDALNAGLPLHAISTDIHGQNLRGPVFDMGTTMSKFLHLGFSLPEVIRLSTVSPAQLIGRDNDFGTLKTGQCADITLFRLVDGEFQFTDSERQSEIGKQRLEPLYTIRAGKVVKTPDAKETAKNPTRNG